MSLLCSASRTRSTLASSVRSLTCSSTVPVSRQAVRQYSSTTPNDIKHLVNLAHSRTYRHTHRQLILFGQSAIRDLLALPCPPFQLLATYGASSSPPSILAQAAHAVPHTYISPSTAQRIARTASPTSDLLALVTFPTFVPTSSCSSSFTSWINKNTNTSQSKILILNGLSDPGNVGTLFRTAAAFHFTCIVLIAPKGSKVVDPFNDKSVRASKGTVLTLPWVEAHGGWDDVCDWIKGGTRLEVWIAEPPRSSVSAHTKIEDGGKQRPMVLVLSGEAAGLSANPVPIEQLRAAGADVKSVAIPMPGGASESLNVASAGAVLMWEISRLKVGVSFL